MSLPERVSGKLHSVVSRRRIWTALHWPFYRTYMSGQSVALVGSYLQMIAIQWLVFRLTRSELALGLYGFITEISSVAVVLWAGVLADRFSPIKILISTRIAAAVQAIALAVLFYSGHLQVLSIFLLGSLLGVINGFDTPARHALLPNLVGDQRDLRNAVSFHSLVNDTARLLGPVLAGMLIAAWGEGCCFFANGASCLFLVGVLLRLRPEPVKTPLDPGTPGRALAEGVRYAWGQASIRSILVLVIGVSFGGSAAAVLMPVMAAEVLHGGPQTLGILMAASGIGALVGAFFLGTRRSSDRLRYTLGGGACLYGLAMAAFSRTTSVPIAVFVLSIAGFGIMIMMASGHTILLTEAAVEKRGRVMSLFTLTFMGTVPFGSLCAGALGKIAGAPLTIGCGAGICLLGTCGFLATGLRPAGVPSGRRG